MLATKELRFAYDRKNEFDFPDINCQKGDHWLLLGSSGSGKTTLLHLLGGMRKPTSGQIVLDGQDITALGGVSLDRFRGRNIGVIFQQSHFVKALTIQENLTLAQRLAGLPADRDKIKSVLERLNIGEKANTRPHRLSVGEQQRASICRALVNRPKIILADEPTSALDDRNCLEVLDLLRSQAAEDDITLLIVTHDNRLKQAISNQINLER